MNSGGILTAVVCFACIGAFHPLVIWAEYHWTARCWPAFLAAGLVFLALSLAVEHTLGSVVLGILGCSSLWSILELREQEKRVERGWFPRNPRRKEKEDDRDLDHR